VLDSAEPEGHAGADADADEWADLPYAASKLGYSEPVLLRLIHDGDIPVLEIANPERTSRRLPRRLIDDAYAAVMTGARVELRSFSRAWAESNKALFASPAAEAVA
jgi:hypothetical protein